MNLIDHELYVEAARMIAEEECIFSCNALCLEQPFGYSGLELELYSGIMSEYDMHMIPVSQVEDVDVDKVLLRSLMLLFTAEFVKSEGL